MSRDLQFPQGTGRGGFTTTSIHHLSEAAASHPATSSPRSSDSAWVQYSGLLPPGTAIDPKDIHNSVFCFLLLFPAHWGGNTKDTRASAGLPAAGAEQHSMESRGNEHICWHFCICFLRVMTGCSNNRNNGRRETARFGDEEVIGWMALGVLHILYRGYSCNNRNGIIWCCFLLARCRI